MYHRALWHGLSIFSRVAFTPIFLEQQYQKVATPAELGLSRRKDASVVGIKTLR